MTRKHLLTLFLVSLSFSWLSAQLGILESNYVNQLKDSAYLSVFVKGNLNPLYENNKALPYTVKYAYKDLAAVRVKREAIFDFYASFPALVKEIPLGKGVLLADTALIHNNVVPVHSGQAPLTQAYTGKDVVIGIIDSGIYFEHEDFKNADGTSRIKFIWDQNVSPSTNKPQPYDYGQEWSYINIDNGTCNHIEPANQFGHGTTVAGIAAGNGRATGTHKGVAPKADIIAVAISYNNFLSKVVDAVDYIFKKADAMGKDCVINTSLGTYTGSHDGKDLSSQLIDALLEEKAGRALVASAGNGNNVNNAVSNFIPAHLGYTLSADTNFTWFRTISNGGVVYFSLWADTADFSDFNFALGSDDASNFAVKSRSAFFTKESFVGDLNTGVFLQRLLFDTAQNLQGTLDMFLVQRFGRYNLEVQITPTNVNDLWRFSTTGEGRFDIWSSQKFHGTSNMVHRNLPPNFIVEDIDFYKLPDNKKSIVSSWQCSDKVITVGNFANRAYYFDVDSTFRLTGLTAGEIYRESSEGPTRDLRLKPDISASGEIVFASGNATFINSALAVNRKKVALGAQHNYNGGTSMSAPIVAGAVALYLEQNPSAWWYESKTAIIESAKRDNFTGPNENMNYGHGKLDAFALLQFDAVLGCTDDTMFNYNPNATVDDGSCVPVVLGCTDSLASNFNAQANTDNGTCIARVFGCTDSTAFNFDSLANTNDGSCVPVVLGCTDSTAYNYNPQANTNNGSCVQVSIRNQKKDAFDFRVNPNPAKEQFTLSFEQDFGNAPVSLAIYSVLGKKVLEVALKNKNETINIETLSSGMYLLNVSINKETVASKKLIKK